MNAQRIEFTLSFMSGVTSGQGKRGRKKAWTSGFS